MLHAGNFYLTTIMHSSHLPRFTSVAKNNTSYNNTNTNIL